MNSCQQLTFLKSIHFVYASFIDVQQICLSSATCITSELGVGRTFCYMVFTSQSHNAVTKSALYLSNRTCYDKTVCTVLFSSRWWVCWCKLFSVLSTLQLMAKFWQNAKSIIREFSSIWVIFHEIWDIDIIGMYSWFWVKWCN